MKAPLDQAEFHKAHPGRRNTYTDRHGKRHRCHSLMERARLAVLDRANKHFRREAVSVRYRWGGRWCRYVLDIAVYDDATGTRLVRLEEVKPLKLCADPRNRAKWEAARRVCAGRQIEFRLVTERNLRVP